MRFSSHTVAQFRGEPLSRAGSSVRLSLSPIAGRGEQKNQVGVSTASAPCRMSLPATTKTTSSATLVAWSAILSRLREMRIRSMARLIVVVI